MSCSEYLLGAQGSANTADPTTEGALGRRTLSAIDRGMGADPGFLTTPEDRKRQPAQRVRPLPDRMRVSRTLPQRVRHPRCRRVETSQRRVAGEGRIEAALASSLPSGKRGDRSDPWSWSND
jgi:hypothetical protein